MSWVNYDEVITTLKLEQFDIDALDVGRMRRVKRLGHNQKGWYVVHEITLENNDRALIGSFGYWSGAEEIKGKISAGKGRVLTEEQRKAIAARASEDKKRAEAERRTTAEKTAREAAHAWAKYVEVGESDYLKRKAVGAFGVRYSPSGNGTLAIPMMDATARVWGLQIVRGKDRGNKLEKQFWPAGLEMKGKFHLIGLPRDILLVAEGYATAATLHQATGLPVAVAFTAGNLSPVGAALRARYKSARILICADDDYLTDGNPGCAKAENAALACGGAWVKPEFPADRNGKKLTDFNDLAHFPDGGEGLVRSQIEKAIEAAGWSARVVVSAQRETVIGGEGERQRLPSMLQIDEALDRFSLIYGGGGTLFDHVEHALIPKADVLDILPEHGWRDMRSHKNVVRLSEVGFDPAGLDGSIQCNLWGGWPTTPKAGSCNQLLDLLDYLCSGEQYHREVYQWVLKWLAYPIQHPGAKMKTALIFHGPQGTGKNLFFEAVMAIYGEYGRIVDQSAIEDKFNDWASRKLFLIADEVVARSELYHVKNKLKGFVTGEWIRINPKNVAAHDERNHVNLVFLSNELQPLQLENDDRRYCVIYTPEKLAPDFYQWIRDELNAGGVAALHDYLLTLDLGDFDEHTKPPMTGAKADLIGVGKSSELRFIDQWSAGETDAPCCPCLGSHLYIAYKRWCDQEGEFRPRSRTQFLSNLGKGPLIQWRAGVPLPTRENLLPGSKNKNRKMVIPPDAVLKDPYRKKDEVEQALWLAEGYFEFAQSIGVDE